jgi:thymidylate kinase
MFIVVEGIDCVDKSAQAVMLVQHLKDCGRDVVSYTSPYDASAPEITRDLSLGRVVVACQWWQSALVRYGMVISVDGDWTRRTSVCLPPASVNILLDLNPFKARRLPEVVLDLVQQDMIRQRYLDMWTCDGEGDHGLWIVVDAEGTADAVHRRILDSLEASGIVLADKPARNLEYLETVTTKE